MNTRKSAPRTGAQLLLRWSLAAVLILALAVAGAIVANRTLYSASHEVKKLHQLLAAGKGGEALGLLHATVPKGDAVALDGEVLANSQKAITDLVVDAPQAAGDDPERRTVTARYKANGVDKETSYELRRTGKSWLFFDRWEFVPHELPRVRIRANTVNEVTVNGQKIPLHRGVATLPVFYPSVIDSSFSTTNFAADARGVAVTGPAEKAVPISLKTKPTKKFISSVSDKVKKYLDECTTQQVLFPSGCPFSYDTQSRVDPDTIEWSIAKYPKIDVSYYNGYWVLSPLDFTAKLDLVEQDLRTGAKEEKSISNEFSFTAKLTTSTTEVSVKPVASQ